MIYYIILCTASATKYSRFIDYSIIMTWEIQKTLTKFFKTTTHTERSIFISNSLILFSTSFTESGGFSLVIFSKDMPETGFLSICTVGKAGIEGIEGIASLNFPVHEWDLHECQDGHFIQELWMMWDWIRVPVGTDVEMWWRNQSIGVGHGPLLFSRFQWHSP